MVVLTIAVHTKYYYYYFGGGITCATDTHFVLLFNFTVFSLCNFERNILCSCRTPDGFLLLLLLTLESNRMQRYRFRTIFFHLFFSSKFKIFLSLKLIKPMNNKTMKTEDHRPYG